MITKEQEYMTVGQAVMKLKEAKHTKALLEYEAHNLAKKFAALAKNLDGNIVTDCPTIDISVMTKDLQNVNRVIAEVREATVEIRHQQDFLRQLGYEGSDYVS